MLLFIGSGISEPHEDEAFDREEEYDYIVRVGSQSSEEVKGKCKWRTFDIC